MSRQLRLSYAQVILTTQWDDGDTLEQGPTAQPLIVPIRDLKGSTLYDAIMAQWAQIKAQAEAAEIPPATNGNRATRRAVKK